MVDVVGLIFRLVKGVPLSAEDHDENLTILKDAIESIAAEEPDQITNVTIENGRLKVYVEGVPFDAGPVPTTPLRNRGVFANAVDYSPGDLIQAAGGLYLTNIAHTGETPFNPNRTISASQVYTLLVSSKFAIGLHWPTAPGFGLEDGDMMLGYVAEAAFYLPSGLAGSVGKVKVNPTATLVCEIFKNATSIGSLSVSTGGVVTFSFGANVNFAIGDILYVAPPSAVDATARGLLLTFKANAGAI